METASIPRRTPLHDLHVEAGGRMVDFAGWEMPVQYSGILQEHRAVRESAGVFDISHMGEFTVAGPAAGEWLETLLTNRVGKLAEGEAQYTLLLNDRGGVIDDLIVYRTGQDEFLLVVNAAKIAEDAAWFESHMRDRVEFTDRSDELGALAVQGPDARRVFEKVFEKQLPEARNRVVTANFRESAVLVVTTGYTGEDGFEVVAPSEVLGGLWSGFLAAGATPCGLGARDTLRLEMCYPLNGSDLSPDRTPLEAGLGFFVDLEKGDFVGRAALLAQKESGIPVRLAAITVTEKSPPIRAHYPVLCDGEIVAETSSGALSPSLGHGIAMAYLPTSLAKAGQSLEIDVRGKRYQATVAKKPFLSRK